MNAETKQCPECGETVLAVAKKCKHCRSDISPQAASAPIGSLQLTPQTQSYPDAAAIDESDRMHVVSGWIVGLAPLLGMALEYAAGLVLPMSDVLTFGLWLAINTVACDVDSRFLKTAGYDTSTLDRWTIFVVPVYLYKRGKISKPRLLLVWIACLVASSVMPSYLRRGLPPTAASAPRAASASPADASKEQFCRGFAKGYLTGWNGDYVSDKYGNAVELGVLGGARRKERPPVPACQIGAFENNDNSTLSSFEQGQQKGIQRGIKAYKDDLGSGSPTDLARRATAAAKQEADATRAQADAAALAASQAADRNACWKSYEKQKMLPPWQQPDPNESVDKNSERLAAQCWSLPGAELDGTLVSSVVTAKSATGATYRCTYHLGNGRTGTGDVTPPDVCPQVFTFTEAPSK